MGAAYQFTKRCLEAGKSVCTSNKELVATKGEELLKIAEEHGVNYMFRGLRRRRHSGHPPDAAVPGCQRV